MTIRINQLPALAAATDTLEFAAEDNGNNTSKISWEILRKIAGLANVAALDAIASQDIIANQVQIVLAGTSGTPEVWVYDATSTSAASTSVRVPGDNPATGRWIALSGGGTVDAASIDAVLNAISPITAVVNGANLDVAVNGTVPTSVSASAPLSANIAGNVLNISLDTAVLGSAPGYKYTWDSAPGTTPASGAIAGNIAPVQGSAITLSVSGTDRDGGNVSAIFGGLLTGSTLFISDEATDDNYLVVSLTADATNAAGVSTLVGTATRYQGTLPNAGEISIGVFPAATGGTGLTEAAHNALAGDLHNLVKLINGVTAGQTPADVVPDFSPQFIIDESTTPRTLYLSTGTAAGAIIAVGSVGGADLSGGAAIPHQATPPTTPATTVNIHPDNAGVLKVRSQNDGTVANLTRTIRSATAPSTDDELEGTEWVRTTDGVIFRWWPEVNNGAGGWIPITVSG